MKQNFRSLLLALGVLLLSGAASAQTFSAWGTAPSGGQYDTIFANGDTLYFSFSGCPSGAWGQARLHLFFEGDDGDAVEYLTAYDPTMTSLGTIGPNPNGDCAPEDSVIRYFAATNINTWGSSFTIKLVPTYDIDLFCTANRARMRLEYDYCAFGVPAEFASASIADSSLCPTDGLQLLTGTPAGGTFSGPYVSGSSFDPTGLPQGIYTVQYTATDSIGCVTTDDLAIRILGSPSVPHANTCPGGTTTISPTGGLTFVFYADAALTQPLDTASSFTTPNLWQSTDYWVATLNNDESFALDTLLNTNYAVVDHDLISGDDRGGIAVTPDYVFINGDDGIARYDLNLGNPSVTLPQRDGICSDYRSGKVWTLWNTGTNSDPTFAPSSFTVNALRGLDSMMAVTNDLLLLSQPVTLSTNTNYVGIFAGYGKIGLFSNSTLYVIDMDNGDVSTLPISNPSFYGSENWAIWGTLEQDCIGNYYIVYHDNSNNVVRMQAVTGTVSTAGAFTNLGETASLVYSPWNNRWYFHYEGSAEFGGSSETLGYADASDSTASCGSAGLSCPTMFTVNVPTNTIGNGNDTTICGNSLMLTTAPGFTTYSWNGNGSNLNAYTANTSGNVVLEVTDLDGCLISDTILVTLNPNPVVNLGGDAEQCGGFLVLDAGNAGSTYQWSDNNTAQLDTVAATGVYSVVVTNANGCTGSDSVLITIHPDVVVSLALPVTTTCVDDGAILLTGGTPAGGVYSGIGVGTNTSGVVFDPGLAGTGTFAITYTYTDVNGCSGTAVDQVSVNSCTGVNELSAAGAVNVYPNPASGIFNVSISLPLDELTISVLDVEGRVVYVNQVSAVTPGFTTQLPLTDLADGIYFLQLRSGESTRIEKLIISK